MLIDLDEYLYDSLMFFAICIFSPMVIFKLLLSSRFQIIRSSGFDLGIKLHDLIEPKLIFLFLIEFGALVSALKPSSVCIISYLIRCDGISVTR